MSIDNKEVKRYKRQLEKVTELQTIQMSDIALRSKIRVLAPEAILTLARLMKSENENVRMQASKILLSKVIPDLKSLAVTESKQIQGLVIVRHQNDQTTIDISDGPITLEGTIE